MSTSRVANTFTRLLTIIRYSRRARQSEQRPSSLYPPHLPSTRIDISQRRLKAQPPGSHLLRLPLELRQYIYEFVLGGRVISLKLVTSKLHKHYVVRSKFYEPADVADGSRIRLNSDIPGERIPIALLFACRQVYLEALPILHRCNTFYFRAHEFAGIFLAALGRYCLADIRNIYLYRSYRRRVYHSFVGPWMEAFELLKQMHLDCLIFEFGVDQRDWRDLDLDMPVLNGWWTRYVVKIRNLRRFDLWFDHADASEVPTYRTDVAQKLRDLMIGPKADERYSMLLEETQALRPR
ncbi:hypothetical protein FB451DRAFT_628542 [Mycena latifolia]|nr:hypothetical protein FB451DRAFT_628542 [Mycena latifolia]